MLRTASTNISIITNFGCNANCWYCVWKKHSLKNVRPNTDWSKLHSFLKYNKYKGKVSVSGGGEPLYNFKNNQNWWNTLFSVCNEFNMKIDVHSREKLYNDEFWKKINLLSFSSDCLEDDIDFLEYVSKFTKVRIVYVVTKETTDEIVNKYCNYSNEKGFQLTMKQLFGYDDKGEYNKIKEKYQNIFCLDNGDYNIYYMPDNTITDTFIF